jgi:hypothetical protein
MPIVKMINLIMKKNIRFIGVRYFVSLSIFLSV